MSAIIRLSLFLVFAAVSAGCSLLRPDPLKADRGALLLVFDTRVTRNFREVSRVLDAYDARATFFIAGEINRGVVGHYRTLVKDGHDVGLSGLRGLDPKRGVEMYGAQKYYQDEIVTQLLGAQRYDLEVRDFAFQPGRGTAEFAAFLRGKGFKRVVTLPTPSERFDPSVLVRPGSTLLVTPASLPALTNILETARSSRIPFATISDLGTSGR